MMSEDRTQILKVLKCFPVGKVKNISPLGQQKINDSYLIETLTEKFVLQKLHPIFKLGVLEDADVVTKHLEKHGVATPFIIKTTNQKIGVKTKDNVWKLMNYVPGKDYKKINVKQAFAVGKLIGKFHNAMTSLTYRYKFGIPNFHDTGHIMINLEEILEKNKKSKRYSTLSPLGQEILLNYKDFKKRYKPPGIKRHIHGDLRVENIRFSKDGKNAVYILDLDTFGKNELAVDMGDLIRSITNKAVETDMEKSGFDFLKYKAFLNGYISTAKFITKKEFLAIPLGVELLSLELSARFLIDAFEEKYFRLAVEFKDLYTQNHTYAKAQMNFYRSFAENRDKVNGLTQQMSDITN